jgi:anti-anti-sigma regulatory factor
MDSTYEIRNNYLFLKLTGRFEVSRSKEIVYDALEQIRFHNLNKVFVDVTEVKGLDEAKDSIMKMFVLVPMITRSLPKGTKTSFWGTEKQVSKYSFFDDVLPRLGLSVKVTTKPEEGLEWLGVSSEEKS